MTEVGIFGGTFSPPHNGHIHAARAFADALPLETVWLIPTGIPPHKTKTSADGSENDGAHRLAMLRLAFGLNENGDSEDGRFRVSDCELKEPGKSYTVHTLRRFSSPGVRLTFLCGTDMFLTLSSWYRADEIFRLARIALMRREEENEEAERAIRAAVERYQRDYDADIVLLPSDPMPVSSTDIREAIRKGDDLSGLLPKAVGQYIRAHHLYGSEAGMSFEELKQEVKKRVGDEARFAHIEGVTEECVRMARLLSLSEEEETKLKTAGLLHDLTKCMSEAEQLALMSRYGTSFDEATLRSPKTMHQHSGAVLAGALFPEWADETVCSAIRWHTTACAGLSLIGQLLYLADYIEPGRPYEDCKALRRLFYDTVPGSGDPLSAVRRVMFYALDHTVSYLDAKNAEVHPATRAARDYFAGVSLR